MTEQSTSSPATTRHLDARVNGGGLARQRPVGDPARPRSRADGSAPEQLRDHDADDPTLRAVVAMARRSVEGCDLASGILIRNGEVAVTEASAPLVADLDRTQHGLGDGPGPHAYGTSSTVSIADVSSDARWPSFDQQAHRCGISAVVAIALAPTRAPARAPARGSPSWCGWLTLYSRHPGPFSSASVALAETLGLYLASAVDGALHAKNLEAALVSRDLIGQAKGIIMARRNVGDEEAFAILQRASQHRNRRLRDVAEAVVRSCGHRDEQLPATG